MTFLYYAILTLNVMRVTNGLSCTQLSEHQDPCLASNHRILDDHTRSISYNIPTESYEADYSLIQTWYRSVSAAGGDMPTEPVANGQCQAIAPIWLNGTLPSVSEGVVERTTCVNFMDECTWTIDTCVKNCSEYNVYYLQRPPGQFDRYCFGTELPCPEGTISANGFTPGCVNASTTADCIFEDDDPCLEDNHRIITDPTRSASYYNPQASFEADHSLLQTWYKVESQGGNDMPNFPPGLGQCQSSVPIWLQDELPTAAEGITQKTVCSQFTGECSHTSNICVKNCDSFNVYYLYRPASTLERYCFGNETVPITTTTTAEPSSTSFPHECLLEPNDPCLDGNHRIISDYTRSAEFFDPNASNEGDYRLLEAWYRATSAAGSDMPTYPPQLGQCQSSAPIWLHGTFPSESDGIVQRSACINFGDNCSTAIDICMKNCQTYNVYYLPRINNVHARYCFGTEVPCPAGYISDTGFTPNCVEATEPPPAMGPDCLNSNIDPCIEGNYRNLDDYTRSSSYIDFEETLSSDERLIESWYRATSGAGGDMPTQSPTVGKCHSVAPMWLQGDLPSSSDSIVQRTVCTNLIDTCSLSQDICVKNCGNFNVYYLYRPEAIFARYCFGSELHCPTGTTSANGFTPNCVNSSDASAQCANNICNGDDWKSESTLLIGVIAVVSIFAVGFLTFSIIFALLKFKRSKNRTRHYLDRSTSSVQNTYDNHHNSHVHAQDAFAATPSMPPMQHYFPTQPPSSADLPKYETKKPLQDGVWMAENTEKIPEKTRNNGQPYPTLTERSNSDLSVYHK